MRKYEFGSCIDDLYIWYPEKINHWELEHKKLRKELLSKSYYERHKEIIKKKYNQKNKNKLWRKNYQKKYINNYQIKRRKKDIGFRIKYYLRIRLRQALKGKTKSAKTLELLGCSIEQLKEHLEKQFKAGMSWDNYGKWHIDHIRPCASFDLLKASEQRKCFNYKNLQPLWQKENLQKGNKFFKNL